MQLPSTSSYFPLLAHVMRQEEKTINDFTTNTYYILWNGKVKNVMGYSDTNVTSDLFFRIQSYRKFLLIKYRTVVKHVLQRSSGTIFILGWKIRAEVGERRKV